ncbi:Sodium- and chloride-dependent GABA transporter 2 [Takifugu flavidus]|uniref:Transporter n=1 Tax=Takifugu flavidus TaxID=433684 RepID=A0A5C6P7H8_9TELE|nr:Sodium- and chloride-dependent GABA transporter 2 [Takifugu flavidus]
METENIESNEKSDSWTVSAPGEYSDMPQQSERGYWGTKAEFILTVMGAIIGPGNVWRFPYLCYKNGGGVFFIPYILFMFTCGVPLFFLETSQLSKVLNQQLSSPYVEITTLHAKPAAFFTATFPFATLLVLLIRGLTLPGALDGIIFYLYPDISRLSDPQVWMDAGTQIFFSYAIGLGFLTSLGSYNTYKNDCYRDCFYLCLLNSATSIVAGFAIFSVLGPGLAFIVYPRAVAMMPMPHLWSVCFFSMVILLGLDSQFVGMECLMTSLVDLFPNFLRKGCRRELLLLAICSTCCLLGLSLVTEGGMYLLQLLDHHVCSGTTLLLLSLCQSVSIGWVYGSERFYKNITDMIGYRPNPFMKYCWTYITPFICFGTFIFSIVKYTPLRFSDTYVYPLWANILGWFIATISLSLIPLFVLYKVARGEGTLRQRFLSLCQPEDELPLKQECLSMPGTIGTTGNIELNPLSHAGERNQ